jgi:hypothetical protein
VPATSASRLEAAGSTWGGILSPDRGAVTFNGSSAGKTISFGSQAFNNVTIAGAGTGAWTITDIRPAQIGGTLALQSGALTAGSGTLVVGNSFTSTGGTFAAGSGTVMLTSTSGRTFTPGAQTSSPQPQRRLGRLLEDGRIGGSFAGRCLRMAKPRDHVGHRRARSTPAVNRFYNSGSLGMTTTGSNAGYAQGDECRYAQAWQQHDSGSVGEAQFDDCVASCGLASSTSQYIVFKRNTRTGIFEGTRSVTTAARTRSGTFEAPRLGRK